MWEKPRKKKKAALFWQKYTTKSHLHENHHHYHYHIIFHLFIICLFIFFLIYSFFYFVHMKHHRNICANCILNFVECVYGQLLFRVEYFLFLGHRIFPFIEMKCDIYSVFSLLLLLAPNSWWGKFKLKGFQK